jgi:hypothetical protein
MQRTIEEIRSHIKLLSLYPHQMKLLTDELIETVATLQREKCAEEAVIECYCDSNESCVGKIDVNLILNAKL